MKRNYPHIIRVNNARYHLIPKSNNYPRFTSNDKSEALNNFAINPNVNFNNYYNYYNTNTYQKPYEPLTIDNYNKKK